MCFCIVLARLTCVFLQVNNSTRMIHCNVKVFFEKERVVYYSDSRYDRTGRSKYEMMPYHVLPLFHKTCPSLAANLTKNLLNECLKIIRRVTY